MGAAENARAAHVASAAAAPLLLLLPLPPPPSPPSPDTPSTSLRRAIAAAGARVRRCLALAVTDDLLELDKTKYSVLHEVDGHVEPQNLTRQPVANLKDVMSAIAKGDKRRVIAAMAMNPMAPL